LRCTGILNAEAGMPETTSTYIGLACAALVLAGFVPGVSDAAARLDSPAHHVSRKGDMLDVYRPVARAEIAATSVEGEAGRAVVSMRTRTGQVAYKADAAEAVTAIAKNVAVPPVPERKVGAAMSGRSATGLAAPATARSLVPVGCERMISVLVKSAERDRIGRCLS
jgi:hypothetical protein